MKFVCDRCQTKYSIADDRVRGKVLKVKCKSCANVITVREARPSSAGLPTLSAAAAAGRPRSGAAHALNIPMETPGVDDVERTQLAQSPFGLGADPFPDLGAPAPPAAQRRPTGQMPAVGAADDLVQWYMALDGNRTGPFTRPKLVDRLMPLAKNADVHIWNERLDGWKPPSAIPEVAAEITRRRAPPPPPPLPGAPRRPTPPPIPPLAGLGGPPQGQARKPTGPHAPPSPIGHPPGGAASKLPPPGGVHPALAARGEHGHGDASSLLETPAPQPHHAPHAKTNGVGHGHAHAPPKPVNSDVMQMLNLPGGTQVPGAPPRLMSVSDATGWSPSADATKGRGKTTALIIALLVVIGLVIVVTANSFKKPPRPVPVVAKAPVVEAPPAVVEKPPEQPPPPVIEPTQPSEPAKGKGKQRGKVKGKQPVATPTTPVAPQQTGTGGSDASRFRDNHNLNITGGGGTKLPPPEQAAITKVISNNRAGIKICYQRALTRDNSLTHGKLSVKLSIGISGKVKHVTLDGPAQFKLMLEPCVKEVVQRWVFPQSSEEYATEFPLVFQGNE